MRMALEEKQKKGSVEVVDNVDPPGPRVSASFVPYVTPVGVCRACRTTRLGTEPATGLPTGFGCLPHGGTTVCVANGVYVPCIFCAYGIWHWVRTLCVAKCKVRPLRLALGTYGRDSACVCYHGPTARSQKAGARIA